MKLWMKVVAFRKPLILVSLVVFGFVVIYEISKQSICTRTYAVAHVAFSAILTNQALRRAVCKFWYNTREPSRSLDAMAPDSFGQRVPGSAIL